MRMRRGTDANFSRNVRGLQWLNVVSILYISKPEASSSAPTISGINIFILPQSTDRTRKHKDAGKYETIYVY